ncbi:type 1 glutamine amidotransferase [Nocardioides daeguensis]|uniref:Type 1 glutamine amidotransferase n=1 Tax=Nocardioides daeguensis TaxID=908359 RepID=A0ABP6W6T9_9ACTN|nr:gamma-glutamyl-gamma-aminobutyrate hydrolase family protein [Nocardioides daeguensis]MBV6729301.1 gamma-glutamyl-gamma-aminobutyrate hydrolase family protein [Nocardioides daeguensis]MCR1774277.1 gamma-glutamyl-gamma-aminobutyrate hydrolase family protein [Nocardioides daeguensis]
MTDPVPTGKRLLLIGHDYLTAGGIEERFVERGYDVERLQVVPPDRFDDPGVDVDLPDPRAYDAVLVLGARWSVYSDTVASWVKPEVALLQAADESGVPVFGICFGGQMLAHAHGGQVVASPVSEIGPHAVSGVPAVAGVWTQWHHDRFVPPAAATVIGANAAAPQAFVVRHNLAVQFHPEVDAESVRGWLEDGGREDASSRGLDPDVLIEHIASLDAEVRGRAAALVDYFLDEVATS